MIKVLPVQRLASGLGVHLCFPSQYGSHLTVCLKKKKKSQAAGRHFVSDAAHREGPCLTIIGIHVLSAAPSPNTAVPGHVTHRVRLWIPANHVQDIILRDQVWDFGVVGGCYNSIIISCSAPNLRHRRGVTVLPPSWVCSVQPELHKPKSEHDQLI